MNPSLVIMMANSVAKDIQNGAQTDSIGFFITITDIPVRIAVRDASWRYRSLYPLEEESVKRNRVSIKKFIYIYNPLNIVCYY